MKDTHILLVEDEDALLYGMRDLLEVEGYRVTLASDGHKALEALRAMTRPPDIIISDIRMPNLDGYGLISAVREEPQWVSVPFIFLSAKGEKADIHLGRLQGADDYLTKPFDYEDLLVSVQSCLSRQRQRVAAEESRMEGLRRRILEMLNHEFRTPLSYIVAYADLMANHAALRESQELHQYINGITIGSERLMSLIERFLLLAELESGHGVQIYQRRKMRVDNLAYLLSDIVRGLESKAESIGVRLEYEQVGSIPPVECDVAYLEPACRHLVENAIKFTPENADAVVNCTLSEHDGYIWFKVCDQGRGIPAEEIPQLFEMFYQVNRAEYEQQGIGVGLAIVKHVADLHGGKVAVRSELGQGSCFELGLPALEN